MDDDKSTKLTRQIDRGSAASAVLSELEEEFKSLEKQCYDTFKRAEIHDDDGRRACSMYLRVLDDVKGRFTQRIITGDAARKELIKLNHPKVKDIQNV